MDFSQRRSITPSAGVAGVTAYHVPAHGAPIDLKLDANEGQAPSEDVLQRILEVGPDVMRRYPDASALQDLLSKAYGVATEQVIISAGADDSLDRLCRAMLAPGRRLLVTNPSFEMLPRYARIMGAEVDEVPWWEGSFPTEQFISAAKPETAIVAVVSPNNPTGTVVSIEDLKAISQAVPQALLLLDHAYIEFADHDLTEEALKLPNTVVVRTLSKAWGLAGLRVGYTLGPVEILNWMRASGGPYAVSRPSLALAAARIETDEGEAHDFVEQVKEDRKAIHELLDELGIEHTDSQGNFALATTGKALWIRDALAGLGISIRAYPGHPDLGASLRITSPGNKDQNQRLLAALRCAIAPKVMVIADRLSEPEKLALQHMAVEHSIKPVYEHQVTGELSQPGWFVGRTADEMREARRNGLVPLCLMSPGMGDLGIATPMFKAGAARVVSNSEEMEGLMP